MLQTIICIRFGSFWTSQNAPNHYIRKVWSLLELSKWSNSLCTYGLAAFGASWRIWSHSLLKFLLRNHQIQWLGHRRILSHFLFKLSLRNHRTHWMILQHPRRLGAITLLRCLVEVMNLSAGWPRWAVLKDFGGGASIYMYTFVMAFELQLKVFWLDIDSK